MKILVIDVDKGLNYSSDNELRNVICNNLRKSNCLEVIFREIKKDGNFMDCLDDIATFDMMISLVDIDRYFEEVKEIKATNPKVILTTLAKKSENRSFQDLLKLALQTKSNLVIELENVENSYNVMLYDPLGNVWYGGNDMMEFSNKLLERLLFLNNIKRQSTTKEEENIGGLAWFFNMFKQEMYRDDETFANLKCKDIKEFLVLVKNYATIFAMETNKTKDVEMFLKNSSFRCLKGFPSFRNGKHIMVTRRNVGKEYIGMEEFVPVCLKGDKLYYGGDFKPAVDTPIQVRLYQKLPNINYIIHSHCYIKNAITTKVSFPCGAIEELEEILKLIESEVGDFEKDFYAINLKGHGSIMMSSDVEKLKNVPIVGRNLPEFH